MVLISEGSESSKLRRIHLLYHRAWRHSDGGRGHAGRRVHFLCKPFDNQALLAAVPQALVHQSQELDVKGESERVQLLIQTLTPREHEIVLLVASGMPHKNIAARLDVSLQTVKLYRARVMDKLQLESAADLVRLAEEAIALN